MTKVRHTAIKPITYQHTNYKGKTIITTKLRRLRKDPYNSKAKNPKV